jgi:hypothetical protein
MNNTYLVQRLTLKPKTLWEGTASRVFGGGMLGFSDEGWKIIQNIFNFDYMGAAEYEFGTIPRVFCELAADQDKLIAFELTFKREDVALNWRKESKHRDARREELREYKARGEFVPKTVYVICRESQRLGVEAAIRELAKGETRTKGNNGFAGALDPVDDFDRKTIGWMELDNGFFFFTDKEAFDGTRELFGMGSV